ncbi:polysaccharide deacetylase family protein [Serpentinicella sp. ANB-PHB4]|uniref:polysaccharide deacetylase family protein n=1 Tax=Serpentinicella sp. ANB-PHB4 TaxID=3074076 RepID=UPI0028553D4C|nr:polysaccharide deacetylase family protein [Serpentinicella sp. ANB-PHB4]MDR5659210.1 polysaccharide deacetylase family protein [Serpentinicella sp. ANB-PHB4]
MKQFLFFLLGITMFISINHTYYNPNEIVSFNEQLQQQRDSLENYKFRISSDKLASKIIGKFNGIEPEVWGENIDDVITRIDTEEKVVALTFDACHGSYDEALIDFLIEEKIPATLFVTGKWIKKHEETFVALSKNPLFEIANHGYEHKPLSVTGQSAYGVKGTKNIEEAFYEVFRNQVLIKELTGEYPKYFRSGTAYYDDVSVDMIYALGLKPVNYNVLGDAGATFNKKQIVQSMMTAKNGSILLFHMNHPQSHISEGVKKGALKLREEGFKFVRIEEYDKFLRE